MVARLQGSTTVVVHAVALRVEHLIVLEELLADVVEVRLYLALGFIEGVGEHRGLDGQVVDLEGGHHALDFVSTENTEEVVLEGKEVSSGTRVSLAAGPTAQLRLGWAGFA